METSIGRQLAGGMLWVALGTYISRLLSIAKIITLARLLNPEAFGVLGIALTILAGFNMLSNLGLKPTLIQYRGEIESASVTVFWLVALISGSLCGLCLVFAEPLGYLMKSPQAVEPLRVIACTMVIDGLGVVPAALLERRLAFKARAVCDGVTSLVAFVVAVFLALVGMKVWSLVWSQVASSMMLTFTLFLAAGWWPRGYPDKTIAFELVRYGRYIVGSGLLSFVNQNVDNISLSRLRSEWEVGVYGIAYRLSGLSVELVSIVDRVAFPAYAMFQEKLDIVQALLLRVVRYTTIIAAPIAVYCICFASILVPVVLGSQWQEAVVPLQFLAISGFFRSINRNIGSLLKATGYADLAMFVAFQGTLLLIMGMPIGVGQWGASGAALVLGMNSAIAFVRVLLYARRSVELSIRKLVLGTMLRPIILAMISGAIAAVVLLFGISEILTLGLGTVVYGVVLMSLWVVFMTDELRFVWRTYGAPALCASMSWTTLLRK